MKTGQILAEYPEGRIVAADPTREYRDGDRIAVPFTFRRSKAVRWGVFRVVGGRMHPEPGSISGTIPGVLFGDEIRHMGSTFGVGRDGARGAELHDYGNRGES